MTNSSEQEPSSVYQIRASYLTTQAYNFVKTHSKQIMRLAALPLMASLGVVLFSLIWPAGSLAGWLSVLVEYGAMIMFAVAIHRFYLLEDAPELKLGLREFKFWFYTLCLAGLALIPTLIVTVAGGLLGAITGNLSIFHWASILVVIISGVFLFYVGLRLCLIFPSVAVDCPGSFISHLKLSWLKMSGNAWALFCAMFVVGLLVMIVFAIPTMLANSISTGDSVPGPGLFAREFFKIGANFVNGLFAVLFASICFKKLILDNAQQSEI